MGKWKHFTEQEVAGLLDDVVYKLDRAREYFGSAIIITSGYRNPAENALAGGVSESAHTTGQAVDIRSNDPISQKRLIWALTLAGFRRMGAYDRHVHVDVDNTKPTPAFWTGESH